MSGKLEGILAFAFHQCCDYSFTVLFFVLFYVYMCMKIVLKQLVTSGTLNIDKYIELLLFIIPLVPVVSFRFVSVFLVLVHAEIVQDGKIREAHHFLACVAGAIHVL